VKSNSQTKINAMGAKVKDKTAVMKTLKTIEKKLLPFAVVVFSAIYFSAAFM